jgi:aminopeptidase N
VAAAFARDETPAVVADLVGRLGVVMSDFADAGQREKFQAWVRSRFRPALDAIGLTDGVADSDDTNSRRGMLLQLLSGDPDVQKRARELALGYMTRPSSLSPTLVSPVLQVAAAGGDAALYDQYLARMNASVSTPEEYYRFFNTLTSFRDPALVKRTQQLAVSGTRSQDVPLLLGQLMGSSSTQDSTWALVKAEWPALVAKLGTFQAAPFIVGSLGAFCSADKAAEIKAFFDAHPVPEAARALQQALERISTCTAVRARQSPAFTKWLAAR